MKFKFLYTACMASWSGLHTWLTHAPEQWLCLCFPTHITLFSTWYFCCLECPFHLDFLPPTSSSFHIWWLQHSLMLRHFPVPRTQWEVPPLLHFTALPMLQLFHTSHTVIFFIDMAVFPTTPWVSSRQRLTHCCNPMQRTGTTCGRCSRTAHWSELKILSH